jgi:aquaporin Z
MTSQPVGWREYAIEAALLAGFMVSASAFTILVEHPSGWLSGAIADPLARRFTIGCAMGITAVVLIYSPWGVRSGAHMNPAVTLAMARLQPRRGRDLAGYVAGQFAGGIVTTQLIDGCDRADPNSSAARAMPAMPPAN